MQVAIGALHTVFVLFYESASFAEGSSGGWKMYVTTPSYCCATPAPLRGNGARCARTTERADQARQPISTPARHVISGGTEEAWVGGGKGKQEDNRYQGVGGESSRHPQRGLALVTGHLSGGLIALDFDGLATFDAWLKRIRREQALYALHEFIASGYEE